MAAGVSNQRLLRTIILYAGFAAESLILECTPSCLPPQNPIFPKERHSNITWWSGSELVEVAEHGYGNAGSGRSNFRFQKDTSIRFQDTAISTAATLEGTARRFDSPCAGDADQSKIKTAAALVRDLLFAPGSQIQSIQYETE